VTKKHLARAQRERIQRRWIILGTALSTVVAVGLLAYGWIRVGYLVPHEPVATVNGDKITTRQWQNRVRLLRLDLITRYQNTQQMAAIFGTDPNLQTYIQQQLDQIQSQLTDTTSLGLNVLNQMIEEQLIRQEANRRGITVTTAEVDQAIEETFGYYPNGTPTPAPTTTLSPVQLTAQASSPTPTTGPTATEAPTSTPPPTATSGPTPTVTATLPPPPTATPYTSQAYETDYQAEIDYIRQTGGATEADFRSRYEARLFREKLLEAFRASVPREQDQVWARHILVADEATAQEVLDRLAAGESWEALASEYSQDTSNSDQGGDLGWFPSGAMDLAFEEAAFATAVGEISQPVQSSFGWHLIQVLGHEVRALNDALYEQAVQNYMDSWLAETRGQSDIVVNDIWMDRIPVEPSAATLGAAAQ
jgi:parvulin-like peptidyl-prolyl isomerase